MNLLFKLLLIVIASAGASGYYARAPQSESNSRPPMWAPRLAQASALMLTALPAPEPHPPVYIASFPAGVENGLVFGSAASLLLGGDAAPEMMDASALVAAGPSDYHQAGPLPPS